LSEDAAPKVGDSDSEVSSTSEEGQPWLNDDEFLQKYRVSRRSVEVILNKIKDHEVFHTGKKKKQRPIADQLLTWLKYVGTEGAGASNANQRNTFEIGYGSAAKYRDRVAKAIRSLKDEYLYWPDEEERKKTSFEILKKYGFPYCVAICDCNKS
jgi:hypothetical protein